jgi:signal transduction histidine kinase
MNSSIHLQIANQAQYHLNESTFSKALGIYTEKDHIRHFLETSAALLSVDSVMLFFHQEPYMWCHSIYTFHAYIHPKKTPPICFEGYTRLDQQHTDFAQFSAYVHSIGIEHQRLFALDLKQNNQSIGFVLFFDHSSTPFNDAHIILVESLAENLVYQLEQHAENLMYKELYEHEKSLNWSKTKYLQILAHDLRAPFHGLLGFTDVLRHERDTLSEVDVQNILEYLDDTAQSTYELLERVLTWSMADGGRFIYHPIIFKLADASRIVMEVLHGFAQKKNVQLKDEIPSELQVFADINMITSVIQNLVSNAIKFTHADRQGVVTISATSDDRYVHLSIQDMGLGMTQEQMKNLFQPKFTISIKGTDGEAGAGLGLVLCKRFVELNFGKIDVFSQEGQGTTFRVSLPIGVLQSSKHALPMV